MMTVRELSRLFWLKKRAERDEAYLEELEKSLADMNERIAACREAAEGISGQNMDGMPRSPNVTDRIGDTVVRFVAMEQDCDATRRRIETLKQTIGTRHLHMLEVRDELEQFINGVDDPYISLILSLRFVDCLTWEGVAERMSGDDKQVNPDAVRKACYRYLDAYEVLHGK